MTSPSPMTHRRKPLWLGAAFVAVGMAILVGLGVWQLQRLQWKEALLTHIDRLQHAAAVPAAEVLARPPASLDFVRVSLDCPGLEATPTVSLYAVEQGEAGVRLIAACSVAGGSLLVDRGFLRPEDKVAPERQRLDSPLVGVLRVPTGKNLFTPANNAARDQWYWRDVPAMAAALKAPSPVPVMLMLESPAPIGGGPAPAAIPTEISNRHMEYALTWFGLAAALAGVYIALLLRRRST